MNQKYFAFLGRFEGPISQAEIRSVRNQAKHSINSLRRWSNSERSVERR